MGQRGPIASVTTLPGVELPPSKRPPKRVTLDPIAPNPPTTLSAEAKAEWRRIVPELESRGLLARVDRGVLTAYCSAWAMHRKAEAQLEAEGLTVLSGNDRRPAKNPAWMIYAQASTLIAAFSKELFISPNARLRSQLPEAPDAEDEGAGVLD